MFTPKAACGVLCPLFGVPENFNFWGGAEAGVAFMSQSDIWCEPLAEGVCQRSLQPFLLLCARDFMSESSAAGCFTAFT